MAKDTVWLHWTEDPEVEAYHKRIQEAMDKVIKYESHLEEYFARKVKEAGGWAMKLDPTNNSGVPDRIVFFCGLVFLVELKSTKGVVRPVQLAWHRMILKHGFKVRIIRSKEDVAEFISELEMLK